MGLLDDLAMGFGLKERTEDYDARTARNIAAGGVGGASDHATMIANIRARQNYNPSSPSKQAAYYLDRAGAQGGYEAGEYRPAIAEDNRPMFQRILTSPASSPSPRPYAIGPLTMDQPLPSFGLLGLFTQGLSNMFQGRDDTDASINVGKRAMGMLPRTSTMNTPPTEPEAERPYLSPTTYTNVFSTNRMLGMPYSQPFDYTQFGGLIPESDDPAYPVGRDYPTGEAVTAEDIEGYLEKVEREAQGMKLITRGPHAGKYIDANGRLVMP